MWTLDTNPDSIFSSIDSIIALADSERNSLGWLAPSVFEEAILSRRLIVCFSETEESKEFAGYILYGGVFPHAKIYQIGVQPKFRRNGIASRLINNLAAMLETRGYLSIVARIASDLTAALAFYQGNGFVPVREVAGGSSRGRKLVICARQLRTKDLFNIHSSPDHDLLALAWRSLGTSKPFYVLDLNVIFDLIRERPPRSADARRLFGAALAHKIRIVLSPEIEIELRRTSTNPLDDALLQMVQQLPQLPKIRDEELGPLSALAHRIIFEDTKSKSAGSPQSLSDAMHLAHAAANKASAYITSDTALLGEADRLRAELGIDVASLRDLVESLPDTLDEYSSIHQRSEAGFSLIHPSWDELKSLFVSEQAEAWNKLQSVRFNKDTYKWAIKANGRILAYAVLAPPAEIGGPASLVLHTSQATLSSEDLLDPLYDLAINTAVSAGPTLIELLLPRIDSNIVREFARTRGFVGLETANDSVFHKLAVGRPLTKQSWATATTAIVRRTRVHLGEWPGAFGTTLSLPEYQRIDISSRELEMLIGPTLICWEDRPAVIQPIRKKYADQLLDTGAQHSLLASAEASFLSQRAYVGTVRSASKMRPNALIFFYESLREGGRGAVVAVARIVDTLICSSGELPQRRARQLVVKDVAELSQSKKVLLTNFDTLMPFPQPCPLRVLRDMGLVDAQNLMTATTVHINKAGKLLEYGWTNDAR